VSGDEKDYTFAMAIEAPEFMLEALRVAFHDIYVSFVTGLWQRAEG
jgi:hypothetical protein